VQTVKADQQLRGGVSKPVELNAPLDGRKPETSRIRNKKEPSFVQDAVKEGGLEPVVRGGRPPRYKMHQDGGANDRCAKAFATALAWVAGQITVNRPLAVTLKVRTKCVLVFEGSGAPLRASDTPRWCCRRHAS